MTKSHINDKYNRVKWSHIYMATFCDLQTAQPVHTLGSQYEPKDKLVAQIAYCRL